MLLPWRLFISYSSDLVAHSVQFGRATPSCLSCVLCKNKSAQLYQKDISLKFFMRPSSCPPDLQAHVASLERSLEEERERCKMERKRRKELHNTLVVREQEIGHVLMNHFRVFFTTLSLISWLAAGVKRKHQGSLQGASSSALWPHPVVLLWIRVRQRMINHWQHEIIWNNWC